MSIPFSETFTFPWVKAPLSLNYRLHRMAEAKITKDLRGMMHAKARHIPEMVRCEVALVWVVNTRHRRDEENIVATLKPLCDGLVDAEVVADDTPLFMRKLMPEIRYEKGAIQRFEFTITELL
jgi:crossover junction endodeoxyribonuclease RusA